MNENNKIHPDQHGGCSGHSATICLAELLEKTNEAKEAKLKVGILAVDISSAYDLCQHNVLIKKCRFLKSGNDTCKWQSHFLEGRTRYVEIGGSNVLNNGKYGAIREKKVTCFNYVYKTTN